MEPIKKTIWILKTFSAQGIFDLNIFDTSDTTSILNSHPNDCLCSKNFPELDLKDYETAKIEMIITKVEAE